MKEWQPAAATIAAEKCNGNANDAFGKSALMSAAEAGRLDVVNALIELGADVNEGQSSGNGMAETGKTALWFAVEANHPDIVAALLRAGADPNQSPNQGVPLLILAAMHETPACAKLSWKRALPRTRRRQAARPRWNTTADPARRCSPTSRTSA